jgi:hypothetical protein
MEGGGGWGGGGGYTALVLLFIVKTYSVVHFNSKANALHVRE